MKRDNVGPERRPLKDTLVSFYGRMRAPRGRFTSNKVAITMATLVSREGTGRGRCIVPLATSVRSWSGPVHLPREGQCALCPRRVARAFPYRCLRAGLRPTATPDLDQLPCVLGNHFYDLSRVLFLIGTNDRSIYLRRLFVTLMQFLRTPFALERNPTIDGRGSIG